MERPGHWETPNAEVECPDGLQHAEKDNWNALEATVREERSRHFGHRWNRGPNGENSIAVPWAIQDPLPYKEVQSRFAHGFDLDGTTDNDQSDARSACALLCARSGESYASVVNLGRPEGGCFAACLGISAGSHAQNRLRWPVAWAN